MTTIDRDLRGGKPIWTEYGKPRLAQRRLTRDVKADVVIIGAGISGAMAADELSDSGLSCVILDKRAPLSGSTAATTALLQYDIDQPLTLMQRQIGADAAIRAWRRSRLAVDSLAARLQLQGIACDLQGRDSLYLQGDKLDARGLKEELAMRRSAGFAGEYLTRRDIAARFELKAAGGLHAMGSCTANPYLMAAGLLRRAQERGARIYTHAEALKVTSHRGGVDVETDAGPVLRARHLVFASGYEAPDFLQNQNFRILSTWAIATTKAGAKGWHDRLPLVWQAADPYLYLRSGPGGRLICGGEDEDFTDEEKRDALIGRKSAVLLKKLHRLCPGIVAGVKYSWAGCFGATPTGLPLIGAVPRRPNVYAIMAYGGNGITFSRLGAEMVRNLILGRDDPDADLFRFKG